MISIEPGKHYVTRDGHIVGPMDLDGGTHGPDFYGAKIKGEMKYWYPGGYSMFDKSEHPLDLIREARPEEIPTVLMQNEPDPDDEVASYQALKKLDKELEIDWEKRRWDAAVAIMAARVDLNNIGEFAHAAFESADALIEEARK